MSVGRISHLKLVSNQESPPKARRKRSRETQLALPYVDDWSVFLLDVSDIEVHRFTELFRYVTPKWLFDARPVPRLDFVAVNRSLAFSFFETAQTTYIDLIGRIDFSHVPSPANPASWVEEISEIIKQENSSGPSLFLFDDISLLNWAEEILPSKLSSELGRKINCSRLENVGHHPF